MFGSYNSQLCEPFGSYLFGRYSSQNFGPVLVLLVYNCLGQLVDKWLGLVTHNFVSLLVHTFLDVVVHKNVSRSWSFEFTTFWASCLISGWVL